MKINIKIKILSFVLLILCLIDCSLSLAANTKKSECVSKPNDTENKETIVKEDDKVTALNSIKDKIKKRQSLRSNQVLFKQFLRKRKLKNNKIKRKSNKDNSNNNNNNNNKHKFKNLADFRFKQVDNNNKDKNKDNKDNLKENEQETNVNDEFNDYNSMKTLILIPIVLVVVAMTVASVVGFIALLINQTSSKTEEGLISNGCSPIRRNILGGSHVKLSSSEIAEIYWLKQQLVNGGTEISSKENQRPEPIS